MTFFVGEVHYFDSFGDTEQEDRYGTDLFIAGERAVVEQWIQEKHDEWLESWTDEKGYDEESQEDYLNTWRENIREVKDGDTAQYQFVELFKDK